MIGSDVAAFVNRPVMIILATCDTAGRAMIARGSGALFNARTGSIDVLLNQAQWPNVSENARKDRPIAVTCVRPADYLAYQIKGWIQEVVPASEEEQRRARAYVRRMLDLMAGLGVSELQLSQTLTDRNLIRIRFRPTDLFVQTPGPGAGARLRRNM